MRFFLACVPPKANHQNKRIVRVGKFSRLADRPELVAAKETLDSLLIAHQPSEAMTGPIALCLAFVFPYPKSTPKKRLGTLSPKTTAPDLDNLAKTLTDRLAALRFIESDANVCRLVVSKDLGPVPGIHVQINRYENDPFDDTEASI